MSATPVRRLFTPGTGAAPPALTGRGNEQAVLSACLADLIGGASPPHDVVLVGPRGNGKTVLLNWFKRACRNRRPPVDVLSLTPADIPSREDLIEALSPPAGMSKLADYYQTRYRELEAEGLLAAAAAVARAFRGGTDAEATDRDVDRALAESGAADARARLTLREGLNRLGYIWCPPGRTPPMTWRTGIPSLTTYVVDQAGPGAGEGSGRD